MNSTLLTCGAFALLPGLAIAQQAPATPATKTLEAVRVEAEDPVDSTRTEDSDSYTPRASTTAFKLPLTLRETPQTVTVIPQQVIKDFNLRDTKDILTFTPGVHVQNERNTEAYFFTARGYEMQTQFDGVPSPTGFGGRGGNSPDSSFIDRVDVLHGPSGLLTGPGSPGGTVNLSHKTPGESFAATVEAGFDSFGGYRLVGDVGGPLTDKGLGGRLVALHEEKQLYIDGTSGKHNAFYGVLEVPAGENTKFLVGSTFEKIYDANYAQHFGIPSQPDGSLYDIPRDLNMGASWAHEDTEMFGVFVRGQHEFGAGWTLHGMFSYDTTEHDALEAVPNSEIWPVVTIWPQIEGWDNKSTALDMFVEGPVEWFGREHRLVFGVNGAKRRELQDDYQFGTEPVGVFDTDNPESWDPSDALDPTDVPWDSMNWGNGERQQYGFFATGRFELRDTVHTILGARVSWTETSFSGTPSTDESGVITPYAAVTWDFSKHWSTYVSYSDIFQPQEIGTRDYQDNPLDPVVGKNFEVGLKLELLEGAFNGSLAVFRLDQTNLAEPDYEHENPGVCGGLLEPCNKGTGLVRGEGFDLTLSGEVAEGWQVLGGYSYLEQEYRTGDSAGLRFDTLTPKDSLHLATSYTASDSRWSIGASARYQSEVFTEGSVDWALDGDDVVDDTVPYRIQQDAYVVFGLFGRYDFTEKMSAHLSFENIGDESYLSGISWPAHGQVWGEPNKATLSVVANF